MLTCLLIKIPGHFDLKISVPIISLDFKMKDSKIVALKIVEPK